MSSTYNHKIIEKTVQKKWSNEERYLSKVDDREKYYCLSSLQNDYLDQNSS